MASTRHCWKCGREYTLFRAAVKRLTGRNYNPPDGEAHYHLGLTLQYQDKLEAAYPAFYKATWSHAWKSAGYYALAQIDCRRGDFPRALQHLEAWLQADPANHKARNLKSSVLRRMGQLDQAVQGRGGDARRGPAGSLGALRVRRRQPVGRGARTVEKSDPRRCANCP